MLEILLGALAVTGGLVLVGTLLDSVVFPEPEPGPPYVPRPGHRWVSGMEGVQQTVLAHAPGLLWLESRLVPHASGPPEHVHTAFAERFAVAEGTLSVLLNGKRHLVRAGESLLVPPGTRHKLYNETGAPVVVRGPLRPEYALPERLGVFLTQAYGFFDQSPANRRFPKALLQMSRFSPQYDVWLATPPVPVQKALCFMIRPLARVLGYRTHYARYMPPG